MPVSTNQEQTGIRFVMEDLYVVHLLSMKMNQKKQKRSLTRHFKQSHSEIFGSKVICTYPKLIAAYHVLHRLREPRHPPCALAYFLSNLPLSIRYQVSGITPEYSISRYLKRTVRYILLSRTKFTFFCTSCQRSFDYTQAC